METIAQEVILSLFFQFVLTVRTVEVHEVEKCMSMLHLFQSSPIPSISIRSKAILTVLKKIVPQSSVSLNELTSNELEYIAEALFEMAASKSQSYQSFSSVEILQIHQEVIAGNLTATEVFQAFNVLDDDDFKELQLIAGFQAMKLETSGTEKPVRGKNALCGKKSC